MLKKTVIGLSALAIIIGLTYLLAKPTLTDWMMSIPETAFDDTPVPAAPNYNDETSWSALPWREDSADWLPTKYGYTDNQATADIDVFFVHPTTAFYGDYWMAGLDNLLHQVSIDYSIQSQHTTAFNGVGKIYAPHYHSVRMPIW